MCVVSNIADDWAKRHPWTTPDYPWQPNNWPPIGIPDPNVSKEEFNKLKEEVEALKELLKAAKIYDEKTGQPDCELEEKIVILRKLGEAMGVDMDEIFR